MRYIFVQRQRIVTVMAQAIDYEEYCNIANQTLIILFVCDQHVIMHQSISAVPIPPRADPQELAFFENGLANAPPPGQKSCSNAPG